MNEISIKKDNLGESIGYSILQIVVGLAGGFVGAIPGFLFKVKEL